MDRRNFLMASAMAAPLMGAGAATASADEERSHRGTTTGAESLAADGWRRFRGRKVGILTNPTGVLRDNTHIVDSMAAANMPPTAVFGPEHGFRGTAQAGGSEGDYLDPRTQIPVYDTYTLTAERIAAQFTKAGIDLLVFDIADIGARFYTYIWSMYNAMHAAVLTGIDFMVLDRPNPIGGTAYGPILDPAFSSGVGRKPIVQQHGMTAGELARFFDAQFLPADAGGRLRSLEVVKLRGWRRDDLFSDTGLEWVLPSPNVPTPQTALAYPGTCLFEGTVYSEGRGTTRPFEIIGAPGVDWRWAEALNQARLPGVRFREHYFVPTFSKWAGKTCGGVQVHITDERRFQAIRTAITMLVTAKQVHPEVFGWRPDNFIDKLSGSARLRTMIDAGATVNEVTGAWRDELAAFTRLREKYLLYR
ncbi:exo-beta-N-acetylmuramidase NamZ domain-containing protein [Actinophytocola glycyrrhizae]|uniref:Exo-beta-N-acetylmuramidase NamZ domain-containing protein n=1 Tax=Actinophytocola glycyrrhizae TaxID=2044873 RepID=A0ABV9RYQ6_9PSEU